jgi:hypothetical protein
LDDENDNEAKLNQNIMIVARMFIYFKFFLFISSLSLSIHRKSIGFHERTRIDEKFNKIV